MGCRHYFVADRPEVPLDQDEFRSFLQAPELGNFLLPLQLCDSPVRTAQEKMTCDVFLSTLPVGYNGSPSTVNETNCNKKR